MRTKKRSKKKEKPPKTKPQVNQIQKMLGTLLEMRLVELFINCSIDKPMAVEAMERLTLKIKAELKNA